MADRYQLTIACERYQRIWRNGKCIYFRTIGEKWNKSTFFQSIDVYIRDYKEEKQSIVVRDLTEDDLWLYIL